MVVRILVQVVDVAVGDRGAAGGPAAAHVAPDDLTADAVGEASGVAELGQRPFTVHDRDEQVDVARERVEQLPAEPRRG